MADELGFKLNNMDPKVFKKITDDLSTIKEQLKDLENIKRRMTTLEQLQMKILSGEIQIGQNWQDTSKPKDSEPDFSESDEDIEFEVVGYSSKDGEQTFKFPGEDGEEEEVFVAVAPYEYNEAVDLPELENVEQKPTRGDDFDDLEYGCPFCGTTVSAFSTMCPNCGRELEEEEDIAQRETTIPQTQHNALDQYYRAQQSGKYESTPQEPISGVEGQSPYSKYRQLKDGVEVKPISEPSQPPQEQLSSYATGHTEQTPTCTYCFKRLTFIEKYGRWYCYDCKKYSKSKESPSEVPGSGGSQEPPRGRVQKKYPLKDYPGYKK